MFEMGGVGLWYAVYFPLVACGVGRLVFAMYGIAEASCGVGGEICVGCWVKDFIYAMVATCPDGALWVDGYF